MNEKEINELWKMVLAEIEVEVSKANYFTFFKKTSLLSLQDNVATIGTSSTMVIDLLKKRFCPFIKASLDKHTGGNTNIVFISRTINNSVLPNDTVGPLFSNVKNPARKLPQPPIFIKKLGRVRPDFTFETLAVSGSNQLAFVSAQTVAKNLGSSYNPFFIYGPVGVGKTHLMQAIANEVFSKSPDKKIIYITSEEFTNEVVEAIRSNNTSSMKKRFRNVDLLIIDDIQFLTGKEKVQEELFHTFNILVDKSSQVVFSSDRPPHEIQKLEKRLSSRFSSGLTVDIGAPDFELRTAILLIKAKKHGVDLPIEGAKIIAQTTEDTRSLEGTLLRVITELKTKTGEISPELIAQVLNGKQKIKNAPFHPDEIIKEVCSYYNLKPTIVRGPKRSAPLVRARQIIMYLLKQELGLTFVEIGNLLGGRDHTTVIYGVEKVENLLSSKANVSFEIVQITKSMSNKIVNYY